MEFPGWGGIPTNDALEGLSTKERTELGYNTSVTKLTFVSAFLIREGESLFEHVGGKENATWLKIKVSTYTIQIECQTLTDIGWQHVARRCFRSHVP